MRVSTSRAQDTGSFLAGFATEKTISPYKKKQIIFSQGDRSDSIFYIVNGSVKLTLVSRAGKEAVIAIVGPGKLFGESCVSLDHPVRFHSAIALTEARLVKVDNAVILRLLRDGGDAAVNLIAAILMQGAEIQEDLTKRLVDSAEESLARVISSLVQFRDKDASLPRISQQTIAEMMGITRQRVNVLMKRSGIMHLAGRSGSKGTGEQEKLKATSLVVHQVRGKKKY
jgi:CRP-like cAMP-binding protein